MRNQKYHEKEECARFIREEYEKREEEKIKELEEEEKRRARVEELKKERLRAKAAKEKEKAKPTTKPKPSQGLGGGYHEPSSKVGRKLPDYYAKGPSSMPSGIAGRTRAAQKPSEPKAPDSYKPSYRPKRAMHTKEEEKAKEASRKPVAKPELPKREAPKNNKFSSYDVDMHDANVMDEIPPELLNQIYSEDIDQVEVERIQNQEYEGFQKPAPIAAGAGERLIGGDEMDVDVRPRYENRRRPSPPPPDMGQMPSSARDNENEMMQKAIEESLKESNNPFAEFRSHPMSKYD